MTGLDLDFVGLPGARLAQRVSPPVGSGIHSFSKWEGGTSYASAAFIWSENIHPSLHLIQDLGGYRRAWCMLDTPGQPLYLGVVYLPPHGSPQRDREWVRELEGLEGDLSNISHR